MSPSHYLCLIIAVSHYLCLTIAVALSLLLYLTLYLSLAIAICLSLSLYLTISVSATASDRCNNLSWSCSAHSVKVSHSLCKLPITASCSHLMKFRSVAMNTRGAARHKTSSAEGRQWEEVRGRCARSTQKMFRKENKRGQAEK